MTLPRPQGPNPQAAATPAPPPFTVTHPVRSERWFNGLIYGKYGVGKTTCAATADDIREMRDVLFIDADAGDMAIMDRGTMDVIRIGNYAQLARIFEFLRLHVRARDEGNIEKLIALEQRIKPGEHITNDNVHLYRTVIIDSLTEVQTYLMYQLLSINYGNWSLDLPPDTAEFKEWGQSSEMIQILVRSFRDLPMNVIFVCSALEVEDERKRQLKRVNLPGKLAGKVQGFLDLVGYLAMAQAGDGTTIRRLYIEGTDVIDAKNRFRTTTKYLDNPTMKDLMALNAVAPTVPVLSAPAALAVTAAAESRTLNAAVTTRPAGPSQSRPASPAGRAPALGTRTAAAGAGPVRGTGNGR